MPVSLATPVSHTYLNWMRRVALAALVALILTPLVVDYGAQDDIYMGPKRAWIAIFTAVGWTALLRAFAGRALMVPLQPLAGVVALWVGWHWIAIFWARSPSLAFDRAAEMTWLALAAWLAWHLLRWRRHLLAAAWLWIAVAMLTAGWILLEDTVRAWAPRHVWLQPNLADWRGYLSAGLGNTSHLGDFLVLAFLPALVLFGEARRKIALMTLGAALVLLPAGIIVAFSAGSILSLLVAVVVMWIALLRTHGRWFRRRPARWVVMTVLWIGVIAFFTTNHPLNPHAAEQGAGILAEGFGSNRWQEGGPTRLAIWAQALDMIRLNPWLGVGTGNFTYVFPEMDSPLLWGRDSLRVYQGLYTNAAHNILLQTWCELGMVGVLLLLLLAILALHLLLSGLRDASLPSRLIRIALVGMLAAWFVQGQVNFVSQTPVGLLGLFGILAATLIEERTRGPLHAMPPLRWESLGFALRVDWRSMRKPEAIGFALLPPRGLAIGLGVVFFILLLCWIPQRLDPLRAQREYRQARAALRVGAAEAAEEHFRRALEIDPQCHDCRSAFSAWLVEQQRGAEALEHIAIVRRRLNSNELWMREARAHILVGGPEHEAAAREALETYYNRLWIARRQATERMREQP